jgi:hypothetical protein
MIGLRQKIEERMDRLQEAMESNLHLSDPEVVEEMIAGVSKFWEVLSEEDRDYIQGAQYAIEEQASWDLDSTYEPSSYDEYQDLFGGDDWDHGQYDDSF